MFCIHCGAEIPPASRFCSVCGNEPEAAAEARASFSPPYPSATPGAAPAYAGFWLRAAAMAIDSLIFLPVMLAVVLPMAFAARDLSENDPAELATFIGMYLVFTVVAVAGTWLYHTLMESSRHQGTLGKKAMGIIVTDLDGNRISFGRANGRFFAKYLSSLILNLGFVMAGFTEKKQALHDIITNCLVVRR
jgi:uncharacterized RDD family membrane protein YckC